MVYMGVEESGLVEQKQIKRKKTGFNWKTKVPHILYKKFD
jgi:hypothetical protein